MPRIVVFSDTHWSRPEEYFPQVTAICRGADLIVHAGDAVDAFVLRWLQEIAPVQAVVGNSDRISVRECWPYCCEFELGGVHFGLFHGHQVEIRRAACIVNVFSPRVNVVIHGHSHMATHYEHQGVKIFNPGSLSEPRGERGATWGELIVEGGVVRAYHHDFP